MSPAQPRLSREQAELFVIREARLLDRLQLDAWNALFTEDGLYWIPLDEHAGSDRQAAIIRDDRLRREERVHHQLRNPFPAQTPRSRTLHFISNVDVVEQGDQTEIVSNQLIHEMRTGDHKQIGLGQPQVLAAEVMYRLRHDGSTWRIAEKKVLLLNRDSWLGNLTFMI
jgi:3-phenylpropionate/cinnamic acid dioxygenase small subunit